MFKINIYIYNFFLQFGTGQSQTDYLKQHREEAARKAAEESVKKVVTTADENIDEHILLLIA